MGLFLTILVVVFLIGGLPTWNYSRNWGYRPSSVLGVILAVLLILMITNTIPRGF